MHLYDGINPEPHAYISKKPKLKQTVGKRDQNYSGLRAKGHCKETLLRWKFIFIWFDFSFFFFTSCLAWVCKGVRELYSWWVYGVSRLGQQPTQFA